MRSKLFVLFLLALGAANSASAQIDFTPITREYTAGGFIHRELIFKTDKGTVTLAPPVKWNVRGGKDRVQLSPPDKSFVEATIQAAPVTPPPGFDEQNLKVLEQRVLSEVPSGALSVQITGRVENPVVIGSFRSFEFVISYQALGYTFLRSVIFVNGPDQQLTFRFTAPKADFDAFNSDFHRSINSWQWIERAVPEAGPVTASN